MDLAGSESLDETASGGNWLQETQPTKLYPQRPEAHHCRPLQKNPARSVLEQQTGGTGGGLYTTPYGSDFGMDVVIPGNGKRTERGRGTEGQRDKYNL